MSGFMDFFKPQQQQQQQPQNNGQQQQRNEPQGGNVMGNQGQQGQGQNGQQGQNQGQGGNGQNAGNQPSSNPLDAYGKLWDTPATDTDKPPSFSIDPKIMDQVVSSQDFTKGIDPAVMQKATQGDVNALMEIIQGVGRNAYRASIEHGGMLTDKFVGAREQYSGKQLPSHVRQELTNHALSSTPNYQHPVVKRQLTEIAQRFSKQHPDASPQEIAEMSRKYLNELVGAIQDPSKQQSQQNQQPQGERGKEFWDDFFDKDTSFTS